MIITDTIQNVVTKSTERTEYTIQNLGSSAIKLTHKSDGTYVDDFGILIGPNGHYTFQGISAKQEMYALSDTGNSNRLLILDPGVLL